MGKKSSERFRNWVFILYPESAPKNWKELLDDLHIQWCHSPLHDKDLNADGEIKKSHYHVLLCFDSVKTFEQIKEITDSINSPIPQKCQSAKGTVRYFAHLDNPEKYQYSKAEIVGYGGIDIAELLKPTSSNRYLLISEMIKFINDNDITEYKDLVDYAIVDRMDDWFPLLVDNSTMFISTYIKSNRHRNR